jgi:hypothetical protein
MYSHNFSGLSGDVIRPQGGWYNDYGNVSDYWVLDSSSPAKVPNTLTGAKSTWAGNLGMKWDTATYGQAGNTPVSSAVSVMHGLRFYAYLASGAAGGYLLDWSYAANGTTISSHIWCSASDGAIQIQWASNQTTGSMDNYTTSSAAGFIPIGAPFRLEILTLNSGNVFVRVFKGANLHADHSNAANYTEYAPSGAKRYYGPSGSLNRSVGIAGISWANWPYVITGKLYDPPPAGSGFDAIGFITDDWVGPRVKYDLPYWGVSAQA